MLYWIQEHANPIFCYGFPLGNYNQTDTKPISIAFFSQNFDQVVNHYLTHSFPNQCPGLLSALSPLLSTICPLLSPLSDLKCQHPWPRQFTHRHLSNQTLSCILHRQSVINCNLKLEPKYHLFSAGLRMNLYPKALHSFNYAFAHWIFKFILNCSPYSNTAS